jgi:ABC-type branched-subunit amino acid transport system substrate-binding protein
MTTLQRILKRTRPALAAVTVLAAGTACATANTGTSDAAGAGITDTTIKVGGIVTKTSSIGYATGEAEIGAKARFERANAEGGVHGRKIEFIGAEDDVMTPDKGAAAARKLVQRDKVFAVVPVNAPNFGGTEFLDQQKVPWLGWATSPSWCGKETGFGWNGCLAPQQGVGANQTWWGHQVAAQLGGAKGKTVFLQGNDSSASKYGVQTTSRSFGGAGMEVIGTSAAVPAAAPPQDWSPFVNKIMKSDGGEAPDVIVSIMSGAKYNGGFYTALRRAGYKGLLTDASSYDPKALADPQIRAALEGVFPGVMFAPFESDIPQMATMKADVRKVAGAGVLFSQHTAGGYWSADQFVEMLKKVGKDLDRASFLKVANAFSYENPGFGKITFPKAKNEPTGCGSLVKVHQGRYTLAQPLKCFPNIAFK